MRRVAVALLVAAVGAVGVRWGTFAAGSSDSYCYLYQAERWATGRPQVPDPLTLEAPWPDAPSAFAPAGHRPSPTVPGAIVPICSPGLSILMVPLVWIAGLRGAFFIVPLFGMLLIGATYAVGSRFGARVGLASAVLMASSPIFLYQLVQPMNDVPAAALWVVAVAAVSGTKMSGPLVAGCAAAVAILVRPNLVPLVIPMAAFLLLRPERTSQTRARAAAAFGACVALGALVVALIHLSLYGSPVGSGYGPAGMLFSAGHVSLNAARYWSWLTEAQTPAWLIALLSPILLPGALTALLVALIAVIGAVYLPYLVFDDWSYVRFLLPAIPLILVLMMAAVDGISRRVAPWTARPVLALVSILLAVQAVGVAAAHHVFRLQRLESRYERTGSFIARRLPADAIVITARHSGGVRFYSGRRTLTWDGLDPASLDRAIAFVRRRGFQPFFLFESWEEPLFRQRFAMSPLGELDWPPVAEIAPLIRIYRPEDRERYRQGLAVPTEYVP